MKQFDWDRIFLGGAAFVCVCLFAAQARAAASVNCDLPPQAPASTISAVLGRLNPERPNTVTVSGTCNENVVIDGFEDLTLQAAPGASVNDASNGAAATIQISHSQRITISGFAIQGGLDGISCVDSSECTLVNNTVSGTVLSGIFIFANSAATLSGNTVQNGLHGTTVLSSSFAHLLGGNLGSANTMELNREFGLVIFEGCSTRVEGTALNANIFRNNGLAGIALERSSGSFFNVVVTGNGSVNDVSSGGIQVIKGGLRLILGQINNNGGEGIFVSNGGFAEVFSGSISNNSRNGVVLALQSTARFNGASTVSGNARVDVFCDSTGIIQNPSQITGATNVSCPNQVNGFGTIP